MKSMIVSYGLVLSYKSVQIVRNMSGQYETGSGQDMMIFDNLGQAIDYMKELAQDK